MSDWINFSEKQPDKAGAYRWRIPSVAKHLKGHMVVFVAHLLPHKGSKDQVLVPDFGSYISSDFASRPGKIVVPEGTQWQEYDGPEVKERGSHDLSIEGVENAPCPFCQQIPSWSAIFQVGTSTLVCNEPHRKNRWWLECCQWAKTPHSDDPIALTKERNKLILKTE